MTTAGEPMTTGVAAETRADLRIALQVVLVLAALGAALGLVWAWWAGPQQRAYVLAPGQLYPFDETERMAAADGRYLVIVAAVGLVASVALWWWRAANRGALLLVALIVGGLAGAALTAWIGYLSGGGTYSGKRGTTIAHLPLSLHMRGLLFIEPALATMVYGLLAAFAARDDLDRADPVRDRLSVRAGRQPQDGWRDRDGSSAFEERDLSA
ncbi:MAG TPA: hypothetical protein VKB75_15920 [Jatrophihabitans sp.]|nr:hypothetical protein [Jatrophihabitans sp.]